MTALAQLRPPIWQRAEHSRAVFLALLLAGAVDVSALNLWVLPPLVTATDVSASRNPQSDVHFVTPKPLPQAAAPATPEARVEPATPPAATVVAEPVIILFSHGNWWIGPRERNALRELASKVTPGSQAIEVEIDGYADASGERAINRRISEQRARAVAELLAQTGLERARIRLRGRGEQPGLDAFERRVEIRIGGGS